MAKSLLPYFILAVGVMVAWQAISNWSAFLGFMHRAWMVITPFFYGFVLAYIINIPCSAIQRLYGKAKWRFMAKHRGWMGVVTVYLLFVGIIALTLSFVIPAIANSVAQFIDEIPAYADNIAAFLTDFRALEFVGIYVEYTPLDGELMPEGIHITTEQIIDWFNNTASNMLGRLDFDNVWPTVVTLFGGAFSLIFNMFLALVSSIFFLLEKEKASEFLRRMLKALTSTNAYNTIIKYSSRLNKNFKQYIYTQTIDGIILGTVATLLLAFVIRSPYALLLGLILGIINYIPYFGSIFGSLFAVIVVAFTQGLGTAALAAVILLIMQQLDGNVLQPKLMGSSFKMSPLIIIVSVTVGGAVWGIFGMLVAIPIVAVLKDILENLIVYYEQRRSVKVEGMGD
jgi:predicted PurR-regulated permease PerM